MKLLFKIKSKNSPVYLLVVVAFLLICTSQLFFYSQSFAEKFDYNIDTYDPDPYYGTKAYWDEHYHSKTRQYLSQDQLSPGTVLNSGDYFINSELIVDGRNNNNLSGLIVNGNVNLYFEDDGSLTVYGGNSINSLSAAGAGIEVTQGNTLYCQGKGTLKAYGGSVNVDQSYIQGKDGEGFMRREAGKGGSGGNGTPGSGSAIGSKGGDGGAGANSPEAPKGDETIAGVRGNNGGNSGNVSKAGEVYFSGNVKVYCGYGAVDFQTVLRRSCGGLDFSSDLEKIVWSCGGGGANGGVGFFGANIGSGGSGASGGGSGGTGGIFKYNSGFPAEYSTAGGGGGAGLGRVVPVYGGGINPPFMNANKAENGEDFDFGSSYELKKGGKGAWSTLDQTDYYGGTGGNGGTIVAQPDSNKLISSVDINRKNIDDRKVYDGVENDEYTIYPIYECDLVFKDSLDWDGSYDYTGSEIKPNFDVVHKPTGKILNLDPAIYQIWYTDNVEKGCAYIIISGNASLEKGKDILGSDIKTPGGVLIKEFYIKERVYLVKSDNDAVYTAEPYKPDYTNAKILTKDGIDMRRYLKFSDISCEYFKEVEGQVILLDNPPTEVGEYKIRYYSKKDCWAEYKCENYYDFKITACGIDYEFEGDIISIAKFYDGTDEYSDSTEITPIAYIGIPPKDEGNINIKIATNEGGSFKFPSVNAGEQIDDLFFLIEGKAANNYYINNPITDAKYIIKNAIVTLSSYSFVDRDYEQNNFVVETNNLQFDGIVEGEPFVKGEDYSIVESVISDSTCTEGHHNASLTIKLKDESNYAFDSGQTKTVNGEVNIYLRVEHPKDTEKEYIYNGREQSFDIPAIDGLYSVKNNFQKNAGNYDVIYELLSEYYKWSDVEPDKEQDAYILHWNIQKADLPEIDSFVIKKDTSETGYQSYNFYFTLPEDIESGLEMIADMAQAHGELKIFENEIKPVVDIDNMIISFTLSGKGKINDNYEIPIKISSTNYQDAEPSIIIVIDNKIRVEFTGISFNDKPYDGKEISPEGDELKVINAETGEPIDDLDPANIKCAYYDSNNVELDSPPINVGRYCYAISVSYQDPYYIGWTNIYFTISPRIINVINNDLTFSKTYDKTTSIEGVTPTGSVVFENIVPEEEQFIECGVEFRTYDKYNVGNWIQNLNLYKKVKEQNNDICLDNYIFEKDYIEATYIITPITIEVSSNTLEVSKVFDGNTNVTNTKGEITFEGILDEDKGIISVNYVLQPYSSINVNSYTCKVDIEIIGDDHENYIMGCDYVEVPYEITPKEVEITSCSFKERAYEWGNYSIEFNNIEFEGDIPGFPPLYKAESSVTDNEVGKNVPVDFIIYLIGPESNNNDENPSNYAFKEGATAFFGHGEVDINKHESVEVALWESDCYIHDYGKKTHKLSKQNLPDGMGIDIEFTIDEIVEDDNNIINDLFVDKESGLITYNLAYKDNISAKAVVKVKIDSKNFDSSFAYLEINANNLNDPIIPTNFDDPIYIDGAAHTWDTISLLTFLLATIIAVGTWFGINLYRRNYY